MLAGKGFENIYNLSGGIKSWEGKTALGGEHLGLELFTGNESPEQILAVAYSIEGGLREFYQSMIPKVNNDNVKSLFQKLSEIEVKHQKRLFSAYISLTGKSEDLEEFEKTGVQERKNR